MEKNKSLNEGRLNEGNVKELLLLFLLFLLLFPLLPPLPLPFHLQNTMKKRGTEESKGKIA